MFLGIIDFGLDGFYPLSFFGLVVLIAYILLRVTREKTIAQFSIFVLSTHFIIVLYLIVFVRTSLTYANHLWFIPFILCLIHEFIMRIKNKNNNKK